jgi:hypothetical protein
LLALTGGLIAAAMAAPTARADQVLLRGGGHVSGVIVERTHLTVVIETGPGRVTLPMARVESIVESRSALADYRERAARVEPGDASAWAALARWAAASDLLTQAREAWRRVLALDASHPEANAAIGRVDIDGVWMEAEDGYRARGLVPFGGRWITPAEHEALVREHAVEEASFREQREADLRVREAEARAREAEARAREAEAAATDATTGGIPFWWGTGGALWPAFGPHPHQPIPFASGSRGHRNSPRAGPREHGPSPQPTPTPPPPSLRPSSRPSQPVKPLPLGPAPARETQRD